jgi:CheY-like chemotaxis protein
VARILVAEDDNISQAVVRAALQTAGFAVDVVEDGAEAISAVQARPYDLVLMDIQMPNVDGLAATEYIRALPPPARDVPIIAVTANIRPEKVALFQKAGMNDHIGKPFKREALVGLVRHWLSQRPRNQPAPEAAHAAFDETSYRATLEAVGEAGMLKLLDRLGERLRDLLAAEQSRDGLKTRVHQLASAAGALGFEPVASLCRALEEACTQEGDVTGLTRTLDDACASTLFDIEKLKAALCSTGRIP